MNHQTQFLQFKVVEEKSKTKVIGVFSRSNDFRLGTIAWHGPWRKYVYSPDGPTIYDQGCLNDIADYLKAITIVRK